jgi:serine/threonine-protein kinase HipA
MAEPVTAASGGSNAITNSTIISGNVILTAILVIIVLLHVALVGVVLALAETEAFIMKFAQIYQQNQLAGLLEMRDDGTYRFTYNPAFHGEPVSLTMPTSQRVWEFPRFPAPFEGLLPEGVQLDALLRLRKLDRNDLFGQLLAVGRDVVGSLRIEAAP